MSTLSEASYKALYGTSGTEFPNNTTGLITEPVMRAFGENTADSLLFPAKAQNPTYANATASGTDTYTATISPAITTYASGQRFYIKFTNANTGAATINLNSLGAKSIVKNVSTALAVGDISAGQVLLLIYDGTNFQVTGGSATGLGGSTGSVDNAALRADGTGGTTVHGSSLIIDDSGNLTLGVAGTTGTPRTIGVAGTLTDIGLTISAKGSLGTVSLSGGSVNLETNAYTLARRTNSPTNQPQTALRLDYQSSGTPLVGIGTGLEFVTETAVGNSELGAAIECVTTDITSTSEDFDLNFRTMSAGATAVQRFKINASGATVTGQFNLAALNTAPSSASDTGTLGEIRIDANHIYVCTGTNTWKRVAIATW